MTVYDPDPDTFGASHIEIIRYDNSARLLIFEEFDNTDTSDPDRTPDRWRYTREEVRQRLDGTPYWRSDTTQTIEANQAEIPSLINVTTRFADSAYLDHIAELNAQAKQAIYQPGSQIPPPAPPRGPAM